VDSLSLEGEGKGATETPLILTFSLKGEGISGDREIAALRCSIVLSQRMKGVKWIPAFAGMTYWVLMTY
jgi:hypothetical protein